MRDAERYDMGERGYVAEVARMAADRRQTARPAEFGSLSAQLPHLAQIVEADDTALNQNLESGGGQG